MLRSRIVISELAYDVIWQLEGLPDKHTALGTASPGTTREERATLERAALEELAAAGLARHDHVHPDLVAALSLTVQSYQELYGWFAPELEAPTRSVLAVCSGNDALLVQLDEGYLQLEPLSPAALPEAVAAAVPARPPVDFPALMVPLSELDGTAAAQRHEEYDFGASLMISRGRPSGDERDSEKVRRLLEQPRVGAGQFFAAVRDHRLGRRHRSGSLSYVDTAHGRYLTRIQRGTNATESLLVTPADSGTLADQLRHMLTTPTDATHLSDPSGDT